MYLSLRDKLLLVLRKSILLGLCGTLLFSQLVFAEQNKQRNQARGLGINKYSVACGKGITDNQYISEITKMRMMRECVEKKRAEELANQSNKTDSVAESGDVSEKKEKRKITLVFE